LAIGIPTATVLGALGSIALGDKMIKDKNKALGIKEPAKKDWLDLTLRENKPQPKTPDFLSETWRTTTII
jgi:hypothetical protein